MTCVILIHEWLKAFKNSLLEFRVIKLGSSQMRSEFDATNLQELANIAQLLQDIFSMETCYFMRIISS